MFGRIWSSAVLGSAMILAIVVMHADADNTLSSPVVRAMSTTFIPTADSYIDSAIPTTNRGSATYLSADASPQRTSYLTFDVQNVTDFTSATLRLYIQSANSTGIDVHTVSDTSWGENTINATNAPPVGAVLAQTGPVLSGTYLSIDISGAVTANGLVSFALTTTNDTSMKVTSKEGTNPPQLLVGPPPPSPSPFLISPVAGGSYTAVSQTTGTTYTGTLKSVGQNAVADLMFAGGGTVRFTAGDFDFGSEFFKLTAVHDLVFEGAGIDATVIRNNNSSSADTEPFNFTGADRVTIRDLTVAAGGATRTTSDAIDFDNGNSSRVERVKITASRGRGIIFDGKNDSWTADANSVVDCVITSTASHGIELLASTNNTVSGCTITGVGGHGILVGKSSTVADQPNKKSSDNVITGNTIDRAGQHGIVVSSGDRNQITNNVITNSSSTVAGRDGIRIQSANSITCDDNVVSGNSATDSQAPVTQKYGLNISHSLCNRTVVGAGQTFSPNLTGAIHDVGTGTVYQ